MTEVPTAVEASLMRYQSEHGAASPGMDRRRGLLGEKVIRGAL
jgi:hypothetical protein